MTHNRTSPRRRAPGRRAGTRRPRPTRSPLRAGLGSRRAQLPASSPRPARSSGWLLTHPAERLGRPLGRARERVPRPPADGRLERHHRGRHRVVQHAPGDARGGASSSVSWRWRRRWQRGRVPDLALLIEITVFLSVTFVVGAASPDVVRLNSTPATSSFPSGHTAAATVLFVGIAVIVMCCTRNAWAAGRELDCSPVRRSQRRIRSRVPRPAPPDRRGRRCAVRSRVPRRRRRWSFERPRHGSDYLDVALEDGGDASERALDRAHRRLDHALHERALLQRSGVQADAAVEVVVEVTVEHARRGRGRSRRC